MNVANHLGGKKCEEIHNPQNDDTIDLMNFLK